MNEFRLDIMPGFEDLLEQRRAEKAEAIRFARAGLGVHDSELVYADDPRLAEWVQIMEEVEVEDDYSLRPGFEP